MKKFLFVTAIASLGTLAACNNGENNTAHENSTADQSASPATGDSRSQVIPGKYVNLQTGKEVSVISDSNTGHAIDEDTKAPIEFYVNTETNDTLFRTGVVVNNQLVNRNGEWEFDESKVEVDGDEIKIKNGSSKLKAEDGDLKYKEGEDTKVKIEKDGDAKIKSADAKTKIEEDGDVKKKQNH